MEETGTVESMDELAVSYYKVGLLTKDSEMLMKAQSIWKNLSAEYPTEESFSQRYDAMADLIDQME